MHVQALGPQGTVERLYVRIVGRLSRPREVDPHLVVIRPQIHDLTGELRPVITEQELWKPSRQPNLIQGRHHVFALYSLSHFDGQTFPRNYIHDRQSPEPSDICQLVSHEIQT